MTRPEHFPQRALRASLTVAIAAVTVIAACRSNDLEPDAGSPISNDDTYAMLGYLWSGVRASIQSKREPATDTFNLVLSHELSCLRGGQARYQGTLAGIKRQGAGTATLNETAVVTDCQFDERGAVTRVSTPALSITGTIVIVSDVWGTINLRMVAPQVTVNGKVCPGGIDMAITGSSPTARPSASGGACGRSGIVPLPALLP